MYVAQVEYPLKIIKNIYNHSYNDDNCIDSLLLAASCLSEVEVDRKDKLFLSIFNDIVHLHSSGECQGISPHLLKYDKYNMLLRTIISALYERKENYSASLKLLLDIKRRSVSENKLIEQFFNLYENTTNIANADIGVITYLSRELKIHLSKILPILFKFPEQAANNRFLYQGECIEVNELISIVSNQPNCISIAHRTVELSKYVCTNSISTIPNVSISWKENIVKNIIVRSLIINKKIKYDTIDRNSNASIKSLISTEKALQGNKTYLRSFFKNIRKEKYVEALQDYNMLDSFLEVNQDDQEEVINIYKESSSLLTKSFCVMLIVRIENSLSQASKILIDFISQNLNYKKKYIASTKIEKSQIEIVTTEEGIRRLIIHSLDKLSNYNDETEHYIKFLLNCYSSNLVEAVNFAISKIYQLKKINTDATNHCLQSFGSQDPKTQWAMIVILSSSFDLKTDVIKKILPFLYDREQIFHDRPIRDVACYALLRIISNQ